MFVAAETQQAVEPAAEQRAWTDPSSHLRLWIPAAAFLVLDLWSKSWAFTRLGPDEARPVISDLAELRRSLNDGAVFGSFTGYVGVFIAASLAAVAFVVYLFVVSRRFQWTLHVALGMVLAGALGNLYDRTFIQADVVTYHDRAGNERSFIGTLVAKTDDSVVRIGNWPDGSNVRVFRGDDLQVRRQGVVRDFIKFTPTIPDWVPVFGGRDVWPWVFNVADASLVVGVIILLLQSWLGHHGHGRPPAANRATEP